MKLAFLERRGARRLNEKTWFFSKEHLDTMGTISASSSVILALVALLSVLNQVSVTYFHVAYLLTLAFLSVHLTISAISGKNRLALVTAVSIMVILGLLAAVSVPYPIIASTDENFELQNVNRMLSTGVVAWGQGTGFASAYSYFPGLEVLVSIVSLVSMIPQVVLMKYAGSFVCIVSVMLLFCFYSGAFGRQLGGVAAALAALSPSLVAFYAYMVHGALAFVFLGTVLLSLTKRGNRAWFFVVLLSVASMVITHAFTSYMLAVLLLLLGGMAWFSGKKASGTLPNLTSVTAALTIVATGAWSILVALAYLPNIFGFLAAITDSLAAPKPTLAPVSPSGSKPLWVVSLTYVGLVTYFSFAFGMFIWGLLRKNGKDRLETWLAFSGFLIFGALLIPYLVGLSNGSSIFQRGFEYLYFLTAPLVAQFLVRPLTGLVHSGSKLRFSGRAALAAGLIFIMLVPVIYYGIPPGIYDRSSPTMFAGDTRLSLGEWQTVASFSQDRVPAHLVYGVSLTQDYVGALGVKEVAILGVPVGGTLLQWVQQHPGAFIFLRVSIINTPDFGYVSENDLQSTFDHVNLLYSSGDVVVVEYQ
jgi:hypothetical protein